jgi:hypothetical protein
VPNCGTVATAEFFSVANAYDRIMRPRRPYWKKVWSIEMSLRPTDHNKLVDMTSRGNFEA